jgi:prepilin-type N-terminal cleavage/methylation domain-containing protein
MIKMSIANKGFSIIELIIVLAIILLITIPIVITIIAIKKEQKNKYK